MSLSSNLEISEDSAKLTLSGKLDTLATPQFKADIENAIEHHPKRLILFLKDLEYMASSGLRILIYFKQKMGQNVAIYAIAPRPFIKEIFEITGFHYAVTILDEYDEEKIKNVEK